MHDSIREPLTFMKKRWVLLAVACGTFMATLDTSIVNLALPTLSEELSSPITHVKWVVIAYLFSLSLFLLPLGRLSESFGRRRIIQLGYLIFSAASVGCAVSQTLFSLVLSRAVQGLGAAMLMANGPAVITATFEPRERGRALSVLAMVVSLGLVSGPLLSGLLIEEFGWRTLFFLNVPVGILGALLSGLVIVKERTQLKLSQFDLSGFFFQSASILFLFLAADPPYAIESVLNEDLILEPWMSVLGSPTLRITNSVIFAILFFLFILNERKSTHPLLDFSLFKNLQFSCGNWAAFFFFFLYSNLILLLPFLMFSHENLTPTQAGLWIALIPLSTLIISPVSGILCDRFGSPLLVFLGIFILSIFSIMTPYLDLSTKWSLGLLVLFPGFAAGLFQSPNNKVMLLTTPKDHLSVASAVLATIRNLAFLSGAGFATSSLAWNMAHESDFYSAFSRTLNLAGVIGLIGLVGPLMLMLRSPPWQNHAKSAN